MLVTGQVTRSKIHKYYKDALDSVEAADKLGLHWRLERVSISPMGYGLGSEIPVYETTITTPEGEWK